jgi:lipoate-protein ligase A
MEQGGLRVIRTDNTDPYVNLATEEYLTMTAEEGVMTLFLWQNAHTVVIGRNQNPWRECSVEAIKRDGIFLARRMSGGGAVYHDMGNLNFTFIAGDGLFDISRQTEVILRACRKLGIDAVKTGRNELTVDGRKFSGHAYYSSHSHNYHHGTIMIDVKGDDLTKYLSVPESKLRSKGVESVRSRVTNLREHFTGPLSGAALPDLVRAMQDAMIEAAEEEYGSAAEYAGLPKVPQELMDKYASEEWRLGTRIPFEKELVHRFGWGEAQVQLSMKGEFIKDCRIYSDSLETEAFGTAEGLLRGYRYDSSSIRALELPEGAPESARELLQYIADSV